ncbi:hypothetical protein BHS06_27485 [Myxococcus xanthus]|uniref:SitI6 family double-CXXCG motif immunity protein n=1 Tax=Myxococcus xanthus TaxID=34 RepID=UPI00112AB64A|nr:double-CXXCG motif protein [Myxococcus xanthus]QDE92419.1 hypothetical protein BHS06_27485 [Myxococcus xanthus]
MKFYRVQPDTASGYTGSVDAVNKWCLPGVHPCPVCRAGGGTPWLAYPCVDLSSLPRDELKKLSDPWPVSREEFSRLKALIAPLAPPWALLEPGAQFGPCEGKGAGRFGPLFMQDAPTLFVQRAAFERLNAAGVRGLQGASVEVRFRGKAPPELLQLQLELHGLLHQACLPKEREPPCPACGASKQAWPRTVVLDAASLPGDRDVFRHRQGWATVIVSERFVEAVNDLELDGVTFEELEVREG